MGLSVGQLEAQRMSSSTIEGVMGQAESVSRRPQRVIDVEDLVLDGESEFPSVLEGVGGAEVSDAPGSEVSRSSIHGMGEGSPVTPTPAASAQSGTYLNNPAVNPWLHNQQLPSVIIKHAKVEHKIMLWWKAQGKSNREVAQMIGYSEGQVSQITRQPWFMRDLKELLEDSGQDLIRKMLEGAAVDSIVTLVTVRDDPKTSAAVKVAASNSLLDRFLGKPRQEVTVEKKESPIREMEKIDNELPELLAREQELQEQLSRLGKA